MDAADNPAVGLINHVFNVQNRSYNDVLVKQYIPPVIAGLTGFDLGLRTYEPANVAIEIVIEIVDTEEKIQGFLPILEGMMGGGLVTLEKVRVIHYRSAANKTP